MKWMNSRNLSLADDRPRILDLFHCCIHMNLMLLFIFCMFCMQLYVANYAYAREPLDRSMGLLVIVGFFSKICL